MSATMSSQDGHLPLETSDIFLVLKIANMAKAGASCTAIHEMQHLIKTPSSRLCEEKKQGVEIPGHQQLKPAIERHQAVLRQNKMDGCLPRQNGSAMIPPRPWRRNRIGASLPLRCQLTTPEATPLSWKTPPVHRRPCLLPGINVGAQRSPIVKMPARYIFSHRSGRCAE